MLRRFGLLLTFSGLVAAEPALAPSPGGLMVSATRAPDKPWSEFPTRVIGALPDYQPRADGPLSMYGGLKSATRRSATGYFRAEKSGDRWWLVDPEGYPYINVAVVAVALQQSSATVKNHLGEKFGPPETWAEAAITQLRDHGFNATGAWSDYTRLRNSPRPIVYTPIWNFMSQYGKLRGGTYQMSGHIGYPKGCIFVFDP